MGPYCIRDCIYTHKLKAYLEPIMREQYAFVFHEVELPLISVVAQMELEGVPIDQAYLADISQKVHMRLPEISDEITKLIGSELNLNSPQQVARLLHEQLGLPIKKKTATGGSATDAKTLEFVLSQTQDTKAQEILRLILESKSLEKLRSSYLAPKVNIETGRFHAEYMQMGTETGRLNSFGSFHPLRMPKDGTHPFSTRRAIGGKPDYVIVCADFASEEPRIAAAYADESEMKKAFADGLKIHGLVAKKMYGLDEHPNDVGDVHPYKYKIGKAIGLGLFYGKTAYGLRKDFNEQLGNGVSEKEAQEFIDDYFKSFPKLKVWLDSIVEAARNNGHVDDMVGRRRRFKYIHKKLGKGDKAGWKKQRGEEREAKNFVVQGLAATVIKRAMVRTHRALGEKFPRAKLIATVHDEQVLLVPRGEVDEVCQVVKESMENDPDLKQRGLDVYMEVEITTGDNWGEEAQQKWETSSRKSF